MVVSADKVGDFNASWARRMSRRDRVFLLCCTAMIDLLLVPWLPGAVSVSGGYRLNPFCYVIP